jgi:glycerophosphoryl diester phosphodiesterase
VGYLGEMLLVAHRAPLNGLGCAERAAAGARLFELDVQLSHDRLVVSHFHPVLGRRGWLEVDNWSIRWSPRSVRDPVLGDVVDYIPKGCEILLDLKQTDPARRRDLTEKVCAELTDRTRYRVSGGSAGDLKRLRAAGFRTWRSIGGRLDLERVLARGRGPDEAVSVHHKLLDARSVESLHEVAAMVVAWTVNDVQRARDLQALGVDGITTDSLQVMTALANRP